MSEEERVSLSKEVHELIMLIRGNPMNKGDVGLSGQVSKLIQDMDSMKKRDWIIYGGFLVLSFFAGAGTTPVFDFIGKLFK